MRAQKRAAGAEIPASVLIEIAKDPGRYEEMLAEIADRLAILEAAEEKNRAQQRETEAGLHALESTRAKYEELVAKQDAELEGRRRELDAERAHLNAERQELGNREYIITEREREATRLVKEAENHAAVVAQRAREIEVREKQIAKDRIDAQAQLDAIAERERQFNEHLKKFRDGLPG